VWMVPEIRAVTIRLLTFDDIAANTTPVFVISGVGDRTQGVPSHLDFSGFIRNLYTWRYVSRHVAGEQSCLTRRWL